MNTYRLCRKGLVRHTVRGAIQKDGLPAAGAMVPAGIDKVFLNKKIFFAVYTLCAFEKSRMEFAIIYCKMMGLVRKETKR